MYKKIKCSERNNNKPRKIMKFTQMVICKHQGGYKKNSTTKSSFTLIMLFEKVNTELLCPKALI